jgi:hypothetical protein
MGLPVRARQAAQALYQKGSSPMFDDIDNELARLDATDILIEAHDPHDDRYIHLSIHGKTCVVTRVGFLHLLKSLPDDIGTPTVLHELRGSASRNEPWATMPASGMR